MNDQSKATLEVVCNGSTDIFQTASAATGRYKELADAGYSPELFVVTRHKIIF